MFSALVLSGSFVATANEENLRLAMGMYSNQRASKVGDLLTVVIDESTSSTKSESIKTEKKTQANADSPFLGETVAAANVFQKFANSLKNITSNGSLPISEYKINAQSTFDGSGDTSSAERLTYKITVRVVDVMENGVLAIRGDRRILMRNETVSLVVTGLVRTRDITYDNKVDSGRLADAQIYYETDGEVSRGSRGGFVWRFVQLLNPL